MVKREAIRDLQKALKKLDELRELVLNNGMEEDDYENSRLLYDCKEELEVRFDDLQVSIESYLEEVEEAEHV